MQTSTTFVASGEVGRYRVLTASEGDSVYLGTNYGSGQLGHGQASGWNMSPSFDDSAWTAGATGIGYDTDGGFLPWVGASPSGNCQAAFRNVNTSLCFRRTFYVPDPSNLTSLTLRMKYEDGFVAFINGTEVARANFTTSLTFNAHADVALDEAIVNYWTEFAVSNKLLVAGTNLLAVQGLNVTTYSTDFLLLPEVVGKTAETLSAPVYFSAPTPGALNGTGTTGPLLYDAKPSDPDVSRPLGNASSPPLVVTVRAIKTANSISAVRAFYRTMWNAESAAVTLLDNGTAPDAVAGDGIYSASLPTTGPAAGQMFRWRFEAQDVLGVVTKLPAYADPNDSPQYFGTVAAVASTASSQLPVLEWFVQDAPANGPEAAAFRGSCYYLSNFYDNVGHEIHGQSTAGFTKKGYDFDFTAGKHFLWNAGERRVKDINLLSNYADKTKTRNTFSAWVGMMTGTPYHFTFPVRVQLNGVFHGVLDMMENGGDRMLERNGLDPDGAFYKIYDFDFLASVEKKTRKTEDSADLQALTSGLNTGLALTSRQAFGYDNVDIAATVNYLVTRQLNSDGDHGHKNFYLYRDTNSTLEWQPIMWDIDLTQGHNWNGDENYFDDDLVYTNPLLAGANNRLYSLVMESPEMRQMFVRRMRTLMDTLMQPPGTANGIFETRMRAIAASVDPDPANPSPWTDGDLDAARWGIDARFIQNRPREEVERVITGYFAPRRTFLFNKGSDRPTYNGTAIPNAAQTNTAGMVVIDSLDFLPASGSQADEYVILRNATSQAVDVSGWRVDGEINCVIKEGTVIPAGAGTAAVGYVGLLHLAKDVRAFRSRSSGPTGGQRRFVQGNYSGQLSARGGTFALRDKKGLLIATKTYSGTPTAAQSYLRITEIQYHPADPTPAEAAALVGVTDDDFEYIELLCTGFQPLNVTGAYFSQGIEYTFPTQTIYFAQRVILAKNPAAFALRYPKVTQVVLGPYEGVLDNGGERLELMDACGESILDFEYKDGWYPATDGTGRSLVLRRVSIAYNAFGDATAWGISGGVLGSPGAGDTSQVQAYHGWDNFHFTSAQRDDALVSGPYADPDGDGRVNWVEYALGSDPWVSDAEPVGFGLVTVSGKRYAALNFVRPVNALDVAYALLATDNLVAGTWGVISNTVATTTSQTNNRESVSLRETKTATAAARFFRLRLTFEEQ